MAAQATLTSKLFRRMSPDYLIAEAGGVSGEGGELKRSIGLFQLTMFGIGSVIGTGIFFVLGVAVPEAGPAVIISFILAGITAGLSALSYAELASTIPVSGSSYTYAFVTLGEVVAVIVSWCLIMEYGVSTAAVAVTWGDYLNEFLNDVFGFTLPESISAAPGAGGVINLPAIVLVFLCVLLLLRGASESAAVNAVMVLIKMGVLILFIVIALSAFNADNLTPFAPFGFAGISAAAGSIFFSYVGFDAVATASEEVKNPQRTMPLAIIFSLIAVTTIYILVAFAAVGAQPAEEFAKQEDSGEAILAVIMRNVTGETWPSVVLSLGAIISIFSVVLVTLYGQTRILFSMSRDGMLPPFFHKVNPRTLVPVQNTIIVGAAVATLAALVPLDFLTDLTSMGTLVAFSVVCVGVIVLRRSRPDLHRGYKVPLYPIVPIAGALFCIYLITQLNVVVWALFFFMIVLAMIVYFSYGIKHSVAAQHHQ